MVSSIAGSSGSENVVALKTGTFADRDALRKHFDQSLDCTSGEAGRLGASQAPKIDARLNGHVTSTRPPGIFNDIGEPLVAPVYLVKRVIPKIGTGLLIGQSGVGKSALGIDLATAIASGKPFFGHAVKRPCGVLYYAAEGGGANRAPGSCCKNSLRHPGSNTVGLVCRQFQS